MGDRLLGERGARPEFKSKEVLGRHPRIRRDLELARSLSLTLHQFDHLPESEREYWIADWELRNSECPQCHGSTETCSDHSLQWFPQRTICYPTMERQAVEWRYDELHAAAPYHDGTFPENPARWSTHRTEDAPYHYKDGVNLWVSQQDLSPDDNFLGAPDDEDD